MKFSPYEAGRPAKGRLPANQQRIINYVTINGSITVDLAEALLGLPDYICFTMLKDLLMDHKLDVIYVGEIAPKETFILPK